MSCSQKPSTKPYVEPLETNPDLLTLFLYETLVMQYQVIINLQKKKSSFVKLESKLITSNIQFKKINKNYSVELN